MFRYGAMDVMQMSHPHSVNCRYMYRHYFLEVVSLQGQGDLIGLPNVRGLAGPLPVHLVAGQGVQPLDGDDLDVIHIEPLDKDMNASCMHHAYIMHASCMHAYFHASMQVAYGSSETVLSTYRSMFYVFLGSQNGQKPRTTFSQILSFTKMGKTLSIISNTRLLLVLPHMFL